MAARLVILTYHRVLAAPDPLFPDEIDAAVFDLQLRALKRFFNVVPLAEAIERLRERRLPARAVSITFDDGYRDNHDVAMPVLARHGLPATLFLSTGYLDGGIFWNDVVIESVRRAGADSLDLGDVGLGEWRVRSPEEKRTAITALIRDLKYRPSAERANLVAAIADAARVDLPSDLMLEARHLDAMMRSGFELGAHTVSHPILTSLEDVDAEREIAQSRDDIESLTGRAPRLFAYPNGRYHRDFGDREVGMVSNLGFDAAVSTDWGVATPGSPLFRLPRFSTWRQTGARFVCRISREFVR